MNNRIILIFILEFCLLGNIFATAAGNCQVASATKVIRKLRSCSYFPLCAIFENCCDRDVDLSMIIEGKPHLEKMVESIASIPSPVKWHCKGYQMNGDYYMVHDVISKCPKGADEKLIELCENRNSSYMHDIPVILNHTDILYQNKYCAQCHNEHFFKQMPVYFGNEEKMSIIIDMNDETIIHWHLNRLVRVPMKTFFDSFDEYLGLLKWRKNIEIFSIQFLEDEMKYMPLCTKNLYIRNNGINFMHLKMCKSKAYMDDENHLYTGEEIINQKMLFKKENCINITTYVPQDLIENVNSILQFNFIQEFYITENKQFDYYEF